MEVDAGLVVAVVPVAPVVADVPVAPLVPVVPVVPVALGRLPAPLMVVDGLVLVLPALLPDVVVSVAVDAPEEGVVVAPDGFAVLGTEGVTAPDDDMPLLDAPEVVAASVDVDVCACASWAKTITAEASKILRGLIINTPLVK